MSLSDYLTHCESEEELKCLRTHQLKHFNMQVMVLIRELKETRAKQVDEEKTLDSAICTLKVMLTFYKYIFLWFTFLNILWW